MTSGRTNSDKLASVLNDCSNWNSSSAAAAAVWGLFGTFFLNKNQQACAEKKCRVLLASLHSGDGTWQGLCECPRALQRRDLNANVMQVFKSVKCSGSPVPFPWRLEFRWLPLAAAPLRN